MPNAPCSSTDEVHLTPETCWTSTWTTRLTFPYLDALPHRRIYANSLILVATAASTICVSQAHRRGGSVLLCLRFNRDFFMVFHFFKSKFPPTITDVLCWRQSNDDNDWIADALFSLRFCFQLSEEDYTACTAQCALHWIDFNSTEGRR